MYNKILILTNSSSGLWEFRRELIQQLSEKYGEVVASTPDSGYIDELEQIKCRIVNTSIDRRGINPIKDFNLLITYFRILKKEKPDRVLTYTIKPNIYGGLISRFLKVSYAVNITGLGTTFQKNGLLKKFIIFLYKLALKKADVVFFENQENLRIFLDEGIVKEEQTCLLNGAGVNLEHFQVAPYPKDVETIRFLFVGRVMREKGIDELLAAMEQLRNEGMPCTLDVLGYCEEDYKEILQKCENTGWLKYYGYQNDVRPFIANAHCFVLPSWHEGMANTNLECAAMGRPVITSDIHGCKEAVIDGVSGYLCRKRNVNSLYEIMKQFTRLDNDTCEKMGRAGRIHIEGKFDKKEIVKNTISRLDV